MSDVLTGDERAEFLSDARDLIDWLAARPGIPLHRYSRITMRVYESWVEDIEYDTEYNPLPLVNRNFSPADVARAMGKADKQTGYDTFELHRTFGAHAYQFAFGRDGVCTKKTVGERQVVKRVATDQDRIDELQAQIDALHADETVTEPIVEYECPKSLLSHAA